MTTNFTDISTDIVYLGNLGNKLANIQNFSPGGLATRTQLLLTKTIVTDNGTNYTVTAISNNAFTTNTKLQSVDFGGMGELTNIGNEVFFSNTSLTELKNFTNATKLLSIGDYAFYDNYSLQSVDFGGMGQLANIGEGAFFSNTSLTELKNFTNATKLQTISYRAFYDNYSLQSVDFGGMGELISIGQDAFSSNTSLTELKNFTNATNLRSIGVAAFLNNIALQSVDFGGMGQLSSIGRGAFENNFSLSELKNFTNATKLLFIDDYAFFNNYSLQSVDFGGMGQLTTIGVGAFLSNIALTELKNFTKATHLLLINIGAFQNNYQLKSVDFGGMGELRTLCDSAFQNNTSLTELRNFTNATQLESIRGGAFLNNFALQSVDFGGMGKLTSIGSDAFTFNTSLTELKNFTNATNLRSIGYVAFADNSSLQSVDFGGMGQLTSIGNDAFYLNTSLTELKNFTNATKLRSINDYTFRNNYALQSVDFGGMGQLTSIGIGAFYSNISLTELKNFTNATKLETIGDGAFQHNPSLKSVDFGGMGQLTSIGEQAFRLNINITELKNFTSATQLRSIGLGAFARNSKLQSVDFGGMGQLTSIGFNAFNRTIALTELKNFTNATNLLSIDDSAFQQNSALQSVDFGGMGQLTSIGYGAFYLNTSLTELKNLTKATNLLSIGEGAFYQDYLLQSVDFGGMGQLTNIGNSAFYLNTSLTELKFGNLSQTALQIAASAFNSAISLRQIYYQDTAFLSNLTSISGDEKHMYIQRNTTNNTILSVDFQKAGNLTSINANEFNGQSQLSKLNNFIKATSLVSIGDNAFFSNIALQSVDFGGMVQLTTISSNAFFSNIVLTELNFGNLSQTDLQIASTAFNGVISLRKIYYQDTAFFTKYLLNISGGEKHMYIQQDPINNTILTVDFQKAENLTSINTDEFKGQSQLSKLNNFANATNLLSIGNGAFQENLALQSVDFGGMGQLTNIGVQAFQNNTALTELKNFTNATNLLSIGDNAFQENIALQSVDFGGMDQLTNIGIDAFALNTSLTELKNFTNATNLLSIGNNAFDNNYALQSVDFGGMGQLTNIGVQAFALNTSLTELKNFTNATQLLSIGNNAFQQNYALQSVDFGGMGQLTNIGVQAFKNNTALTELKNFTNATQLLSIGDGSFFSNIALQSVDFGGMGQLTNIGVQAFANNTKVTELKNFTNATQLLSIGDEAFFSNIALQSVDFGGMGELTSIGVQAFANNTNVTELKNFTNATQLLSIGNNAFDNNSKLQSVDFGGMGELTSIGVQAFKNNTALTELKNFTNATQLLSIGNNAFQQNYALQSVDFGGMGQLSSIGVQAFFNNTNVTELKNFTNATNLLSIGDEAFFSNIALQSVDFGGMGQLAYIGIEAFAYNTKVTQLNFGNLSQTALQIDTNAFNSAISLRQIYYQDTAFLTKLTSISGGEKHMYIQRNTTNNTILSIDFQKAGNLTSINASEFQGQIQLSKLNNFSNATNLRSIGNNAFQENSALQSVDFDRMGQLTSIGSNAFFSNTALTELNFGNLSQTALQIATNAFNNAISLRQIYYQDTAFLMKLTSISGDEKHMYIQRNTTNNTILTVDFQKAGNLTSINTDEFKGQDQLSKLNNFTNATKLQSIGTGAFYENFALQSLDFGGMGQLTSIGISAFYLNTALIALNNFNYATSLKTINAGAFQECSSIQTIFFPTGLTDIRTNAFNSNISLRNTAFNDPTPTSIAADAFINCTSLKSIYHYGTDISQLTQLTALANGTLYDLSQDIVDYADYDTHLASAFNNYDITNEVQISDIKNIYAANLIQIALNGTIFDPALSNIQVKVGSIPFVAEQLDASPTDTLRLYPNYTTPNNRYIIGSNTDPVYIQMNLGSVLYLNTNETITKNTNNTYTYSGTPIEVYQPGNSITIDNKTIIFGGVLIGDDGGGGGGGGGNNYELGGMISGISPKPIIIVERGNERGANRQILRRAGFFNMNTYTQENPGNNVNYILDSGIPVKNKTYLNKDSSDRTRKLKLKAQNKTYNDPSFGGNDSNGAYCALAKARH
jgi:hypothetical protein